MTDFFKSFALIISGKEEYQIVLAQLSNTSKVLYESLHGIITQNPRPINLIITEKLYFDFSVLHHSTTVSAPSWNPRVAKHLLNKKSLLNSLKYYTKYGMIYEFYTIFKSIENKIKCRECFYDKIQCCDVVPYEIWLLVKNVRDEEYDCPKCKKVLEIKHSESFSI
jgi:Zn finger protein HypA/HybF involved in hydrogenase expression